LLGGLVGLLAGLVACLGWRLPDGLPAGHVFKNSGRPPESWQ